MTSNVNRSDSKEEQPDTREFALGYHLNRTTNRLKLSIIPPSALPVSLKPAAGKLKFRNKKEVRPPAIVCCVVDVSGSMSTEATLQDADGKTESHGLSLLDIVKHSIKTIVHCLQPTDYFSLVKFSSGAEVVHNLVQMSKKNQKAVLKSLESLTAAGGTNLWQGLFVGLEELRTTSSKLNVDPCLSNSAVFLFTDGRPNVIPPRGHLAMLDKYIANNNGTLPGIINTYGFGYNLDSVLLNDLAIKGKGYYGFIPDAGMVGTVFVNAISNFLCNAAKNIELKVEIKAKSYKVIGEYVFDDDAGTLTFRFGSLMYEQPKDILIEFGDDDAVANEGEAEGKLNDNGNQMLDTRNAGAANVNDKLFRVKPQDLKYVDLKTNKRVTASKMVALQQQEDADEVCYFRLLSVSKITEFIEMAKLNELKNAETGLKELIASVKSCQVSTSSDQCKDLVKDLSGQIFEAFSRKDWYDRWGKHYLFSFLSAHLHQYCNNFKDPGVQHYGGKMFEKFRDSADEIFCKLPAPTPSRAQKNMTAAFSNIKTPAKPVQMGAYYNQSGGCFHGDGLVRMADSSLKRVADVCKGDVVYGFGGASSVVRCVVEMQVQSDVLLCTLQNGLKITPWHPVFVDRQWQFPNDLGEAEKCRVSKIYNFVLDSGHAMVVNGVVCVTLGHGFKCNQVVKHEYFGSPRVVQDLMSKQGWQKGLVSLGQNTMVRDQHTGLVQYIR